MFGLIYFCFDHAENITKKAVSLKRVRVVSIVFARNVPKCLQNNWLSKKNIKSSTT